MKAPTLYAVSFALVALSAFSAYAQEKCKRSGELTGTATITQDHAIDVGDVPGHQVRVYEIRRILQDTQPNCEGLKSVERWTRGLTDYTDRNGKLWTYTIIVLDNGDKIFSRAEGTSAAFVDSDGSKKSTSTSIETYTGGTGRYVGIRGVSRNTSRVDLDKKTVQTSYDSEYWFQK
jgi:hypothetical protein